MGVLSPPSPSFLSSGTGLAILGHPGVHFSLWLFTVWPTQGLPRMAYLQCPGLAWSLSITHDPLPSGDHQDGWISSHTNRLSGGFLPIPG